MIRKDARLQYVLLALVAVIGLLHAVLGSMNSYGSLAHGTERVATPFYSGTLAHVVHVTPVQAHESGVPTGSSVFSLTMATPAAQAAGLHAGDVVLSIDGRPYTSLMVLLEELQKHAPGDLLEVSYWRGGTPSDQPPIHTSIRLAPEHVRAAPLWAWSLQLFFTFLPVFCLLTGLYVVFARPRSAHAWLILGILAYFGALFLRPASGHSTLMALTSLWTTVAQTAMPLCFMLFGVYFPERANVDRRAPWIKWMVVVIILGLLPLDLLFDYGSVFNFNAIGWLYPRLGIINGVENLVSAAGIFYAFVCLWSKIYTDSIAPDARRRLRVLIAGCSLGLTPFFGLLAWSMRRGTDLGDGVPQWVALSVFGVLFVFPLTLAYVVVVQRAMDLRILLRQGTKYFFAKQSLVVFGIALATLMSHEITIAIHNNGQRRAADFVRLFAIVAIFVAYRWLGVKRMQRWIDQKFFREAYSTEQLLSEISDEARNYVEAAPLLETISRRLGETLHIERIAVFLRAGDVFQMQCATGMPMGPGPILSLSANSTTITRLTRGKSSPATVYREDPTSWLVDASDAERAALSDLSTELLVPLPGRNRLVGVIALGPKLSEEPYSKSDRHLLQTVASQTGLALENAELLENLTKELAQKASLNREIEIAREVQERLFPQTYPEVAGVDLAGYCRPAQFVGGDYYDFFLIPQPGEGPAHRLAIAIGDISGKGISAALLMASLRASLRSVATLQGEGDSRNLATLMQHVNRLVYEASTTNRYATFFYAELDPHTRVLTYVNAGHNCPAILRGREAIQLQPTGTVVGLLQDACYEQASIQLAPGDTLLAFTDGISEAMTADDEEWGEDRMIAAAQALLGDPGCTYSAGQMLECILSQADAFTAGAPQHDDMTLLICTLD
jgi:sigma-B regulation protein RsbU (phosphoserine phosphatase)